MNYFSTTILLVTLICAMESYCCQTKNHYSYNVIECTQPQIHALGEYILERIKAQREIRPSTCEKDNISFLRKAPFTTDNKDFDSRKLAGVWMYKNKNEQDTTYAGPEKTLEVLREGNSFNVLVDKKFAVRRYVLRNSTDGSLSVAYLSDEQLMTKISTEMYWNHQDVVECENFLYYLSKEFENRLFSITLVDKYNSNDELRFIMTTGGIGGFLKKQDDPKETEGDDDKVTVNEDED